GDPEREEFVKMRQNTFFLEIDEMLNNPTSARYVKQYLDALIERDTERSKLSDAMEIWSARGSIIPPPEVLSNYLDNPVSKSLNEEYQYLDETMILSTQDTVRAHILGQALAWELQSLAPQIPKENTITSEISQLYSE